MKLHFITMMVKDLERSLTFYRDLAGLQVTRRFNPGPGEIVFLANGEGETMLELVQFPNAETVSTRGLVLSFAAQGELEDLRAKATKLGFEPSPVIIQGPKPAYFTLSDPDGVAVEFGL